MQERIELIRELHSQGLIDREIAKLVGLSQSRVTHYRMFYLGLTSIRELRLKKVFDDIKKLHSLGMNDAEIAEELSLTKKAVHRYRNDIFKLPANYVKRDYATDEDRIKGYMIRNIKGSCKRRGLDFNLEYTDLVLPEFCPILKVRLRYRDEIGFNDNDRATVDRIDNSKGYVKGNVWILSRLANTMKNESSLDQLELFCTNALKFIENHRALGGITQS